MTTGFILVFTVFGLTSIYLSGSHSQIVENQVAGNKAFWLAEAGIQRAFSKLPDTRLNDADVLLAEGDYTVTTDFKYPGNDHRWVIDSIGHVGPVTRRIHVEVGSGIAQAFQTSGYLKSGSEDQIDPPGSYSEGPENFTFTFEGLFGNLNSSTPGVQVLTNPPNNPVVADGIIWVDGDLKISNTGWNYKGILIVNGSFEMTGGSFAGIVWINGSAKMIEGNPGVTGAVFVNDPDGGQTKIDSHSAWLAFDEEAIDNAYDYFSISLEPGIFRHIVKWAEV